LRLDAIPFARLHPDAFFCFDLSYLSVKIIDGDLEKQDGVGDTFYAACTGAEAPVKEYTWQDV
jgi:hypothetical protein